MDYASLYTAGEDYNSYFAGLDERAKQKIKKVREEVDLLPYQGEIKELPPRKILAFSEGWCPDCLVNVTILAELADRHPGWELKLLGRAGHEDVLAGLYRDGQARIPTVLFLDDEYQVKEVFKEKPTLVKEVEAGDDQLKRVKIKKEYREGRLWEETVRDTLYLFAK